MTLCAYCNRPLRAIGNSRKNGADHKPPRHHKFHKKCYKMGSYIETQKAESESERQRLQAVMNDIVERMDITNLFPSRCSD